MEEEKGSRKSLPGYQRQSSPQEGSRLDRSYGNDGRTFDRRYPRYCTWPANLDQSSQHSYGGRERRTTRSITACFDRPLMHSDRHTQEFGDSVSSIEGASSGHCELDSSDMPQKLTELLVQVQVSARRRVADCVSRVRLSEDLCKKRSLP
eukprot:756055-Hanusia_phi.AAC.8